MVFCNCFLTGGGVITLNEVTLVSSSFMTTPPTFTLFGSTVGGPPVEYTWTRNGDVITNDDSYSINIDIDNTRPIDVFIERFINSYYGSTLIVTGLLPGVYRYFVNNRVTPTSLNTSFNIEGNNYISQKINRAI